MMSERWKPGLNEVFWYINSGNKIDYTTNNGFGIDEEKIAAGNCFFTQAEAEAAAEKVKALLLNLPDNGNNLASNLPDKKQPKLTAEVFDRPDCPEWAKYAAVDKDSEGFYYRNKPKKEGNKKWSLFGVGDYQHIGKFDPSDWQNSLIERPAKLPEWCKVGEWVYCTQTGNYGKILSVDAEQVNIQLSSNETFSAKTNMMLKYGKAARLRPFNVDEMKALVGKVTKDAFGNISFITGYCAEREAVFSGTTNFTAECLLHSCYFLDNAPCGVLEHLENGEWVE